MGRVSGGEGWGGMGVGIRRKSLTKPRYLLKMAIDGLNELFDSDVKQTVDTCSTYNQIKCVVNFF